MKLKTFWSTMFMALVLIAPSTAGASEELARLKNCLACHKMDVQLVGPAFQDIAAKYKGDAAAVDNLAEKIKHGGVGVWGKIPMPPNPHVNDEDAKTLVEWILSL